MKEASRSVLAQVLQVLRPNCVFSSALVLPGRKPRAVAMAMAHIALGDVTSFFFARLALSTEVLLDSAWLLGDNITLWCNSIKSMH